MTVIRRGRANQPRSSRSPSVSRSRSGSSGQQNYQLPLRRSQQRELDRPFSGHRDSLSEDSHASHLSGHSNSNAALQQTSRANASSSAPVETEASLDTDAVSTSSIDGIAVSAAASRPRPAALYVPSQRRGPSISDWDSDAGETMPH